MEKAKVTKGGVRNQGKTRAKGTGIHLMESAPELCQVCFPVNICLLLLPGLSPRKGSKANILLTKKKSCLNINICVFTLP